MYTKGDSLFRASAGFEVLRLRTVLQLLVPDVLPFSSRVSLWSVPRRAGARHSSLVVFGFLK
jgi:hypothetical protein